MNGNLALDPALVAGQTMGQSLFQAVIIIIFLAFIAWVVKMAFEY